MIRYFYPLLKNTRPSFLALILSISLGLKTVHAQSPTELKTDSFDISLQTGKQLYFFEDTSGLMTLNDILNQAQFRDTVIGTGDPQGHYWITFKLFNTSEFDQEVVCIYDRTTLIDLYQLQEEAPPQSFTSGSGRKSSEISQKNNRRVIRFRLKRNAESKFYLKLTNTTDYRPDFGVRLINASTYSKEEQARRIRDFTFFGAILVLLVYSVSLFIIHKYKPYLWLALHALGLMMYTFVGRDYFVHWFVPELPQLAIATPWALFGLFALFMLAKLFLKTSEKYKKWHQLFWGLRIVTIVQILVSAFLMISYGKFVMATLITIVYFLISVILLVVFIIRIWKKLDRSQKVFGFGILFFVSVTIMALVSWLMIETFGRTTATAMSAIAPLGQVLIFAIALGFRMRQHEVDKNVALDELNTVLTEQNRVIESEVVERTAEINEQKQQLEERNERIETLFREIHHRVKNNLQLISSLLNMQQEWSTTEDPAKAIEDSRSRVVAMSMIHQFLYRTDDISTINFKQYAEELANRLDEIQVNKVTYQLNIDFDQEYVFDIDTSISLGLILNELITNSYKHALLDNRQLEIGLTLRTDKEGYFKMVYSDNGQPITTPFEEVVTKGFGLRLASRLSRQLQGSFDYAYKDKNCFSVTFAREEMRLQLADG